MPFSTEGETDNQLAKLASLCQRWWADAAMREALQSHTTGHEPLSRIVQYYRKFSPASGKERRALSLFFISRVRPQPQDEAQAITVLHPDWTAKSEEGLSVLHWVARLGSEKEAIFFAQFAIKQGAEVGCQCICYDAREALYPHEYAAFHGKEGLRLVLARAFSHKEHDFDSSLKERLHYHDEGLLSPDSKTTEESVPTSPVCTPSPPEEEWKREEDNWKLDLSTLCALIEEADEPSRVKTWLSLHQLEASQWMAQLYADCNRPNEAFWQGKHAHNPVHCAIAYNACEIFAFFLQCMPKADGQLQDADQILSQFCAQYVEPQYHEVLSAVDFALKYTTWTISLAIMNRNDTVLCRLLRYASRHQLTELCDFFWIYAYSAANLKLLRVFLRLEPEKARAFCNRYAKGAPSPKKEGHGSSLPAPSDLSEEHAVLQLMCKERRRLLDCFTRFQLFDWQAQLCVISEAFSQGQYHVLRYITRTWLNAIWKNLYAHHPILSKGSLGEDHWETVYFLLPQWDVMQQQPKASLWQEALQEAIRQGDSQGFTCLIISLHRSCIRRNWDSQSPIHRLFLWGDAGQALLPAAMHHVELPEIIQDWVLSWWEPPKLVPLVRQPDDPTSSRVGTQRGCRV